ncbi:SPOR domain-containing protein [candidate division KSB1 bacterium]|nr:SPOR domain-containing protein [candidate division KSB1 bacterium]
MSRPKITVVILLLYIAVIHPATLQQVEKLLVEKKFTELDSLLPDLKRQFPDHPTVLYLTGVLQTDADLAFYYYHKVANMPQSAFADDAVFRMAQYYYAKQNYKLSRQYFMLVPEHFPGSPLTDDALYMICQNYLALGKFDSAQVFFKAFIEKAPRSSFVDLAVMDLDFIEGLQLENESKSAVPLGIRHYCIQVGAFANKENARNLLSSLDLDVETEIVEKVVDGKKLYIALVGKFQTSAMAKDFAERILEKTIQDYRIVQRIKI